MNENNSYIYFLRHQNFACTIAITRLNQPSNGFKNICLELLQENAHFEQNVIEV